MTTTANWNASDHPRQKPGTSDGGQFRNSDSNKGMPATGAAGMPYDSEPTGISPELAKLTPQEWTGRAIHIEYDDGNAEDAYSQHDPERHAIINATTGETIATIGTHGDTQPADGIAGIQADGQYEATDLAIRQYDARYSPRTLRGIDDPDAIDYAKRDHRLITDRELTQNPNLNALDLQEIELRYQDDPRARTLIRANILANPQSMRNPVLHRQAREWYRDAGDSACAMYDNAVARNPAATRDELKRVSEVSHDYDTLRAVARNPNSDDLALRNAASRVRDEQTKLFAIEHPNADLGTVKAVYATSVDPYTRAEALQHPACPPSLLAQAAASPRTQYIERLAIKSNANTPDRVLKGMG